MELVHYSREAKHGNVYTRSPSIRRKDEGRRKGWRGTDPVKIELISSTSRLWLEGTLW